MAGYVEADPAAVAAFIHDPAGPVADHLRSLGRLVEAETTSLLSNRMVNIRTGRLVGAVTSEFAATPGGIEVRVGVDGVTYARYVHDGTRPHVIRARRAKALRFESRGRVVFARSVNHPGTAPRPFLREALEVIR